MVSFCIQNPVKVAVGVIVVALFGLIALWQIPIQLTPEVRTPTITVRVRWPGASPYEVEHEIVQNLEEQLKDVRGMARMTSTSAYAEGTVTLEFPVGTDLTQAMLELNSRLNQLREFPDDAFEPVISTADLSYRPVCWFVVSSRVPSDEELERFVAEHPHLRERCQPLIEAHKWDLRLYRLTQLVREDEEIRGLLPVSDVRKHRRFVEEHVKSRFDRVNGVADTWVMGGRKEEMHVIVDAEKLAARKLTIEDLRRALQIRNKDTSGGEIWDGKRRYVVRTLGQFTDPRQIEDVIIDTHDGATTYVKDVARVELGYQRPTGMYRRGGNDLIGLGIRAETGANVLEIVADIREVTEELNAGILAERGLKISEVWSDADYIESSVGLVQQNIVIGGVLTIAVLLLFLRSVRSTIVIAIAVPTSIVGTFLVLRLLGRSLNVVSLAGLAFAVGMIVDNSVVVLENIFRHYQLGSKPLAAAWKGTREVWGAVLASTLTTLAVFIPVLFTQQEAGQLFRDIALAISTAVGLSLILAVTVIPTAAARLLSAGRSRRSRRVAWPGMAFLLEQIPRRFAACVVDANHWLLQGTLRRVLLVVGIVGGALLLSWAAFPDVEYLPEGNKARLRCKLYTPPGYNVDESNEIAERVFQKFYRYWEVDPASPAAAQLDLPPLRDLLVLVRPGEIMVQVQTEDPRRIREWLPRLERLGQEFPDLRASAGQLSLFSRSSRKIDVEVTGPDVESVIAHAKILQDRIEEVLPGARTAAVPGLWNANPELHVKPRWNRLAEVGLDATQLGYVVDALTDGAYVADYSIGGEKIDLRIIGRDSHESRTQDLGSRSVATGTGQVVPLASLAEFRIDSGPPAIFRVERRRAMIIEVQPPDGMALSKASQVIRQDVVFPLRKAGAIEPGIHVQLGGTADRLVEAWEAMRFNLLLALVITYLLMAGLFESWIYPLVIIISVPLAAVGGVVCLAAMNRVVAQPLDIITMLGFIILIGTAVNNAILIVHHSIQLMAEGQAPDAAVEASVASRIRPIFMTTGTTVLGLLPLVVMPGAGSELYRGLGCVVLGGLVVSTMLTLFLVPSFFSLVMETRERFRRRRTVDVPAATAPARSVEASTEVAG